MTRDNGLPDGWKWVKLGEACTIVSGNTPKGLEQIKNTGEFHFYKVSDMNLDGNEVKMSVSNLKLTSEEIARLKVKVYPKGTVIFPKRGGAILTNKKRILSRDASFDLNLMGFVPSAELSSDYLFYWVQKLDLSKIYDGSNVPQINNKNVAPLDFPLSPLGDQHGIVSKIEELLSELDKGKQQLETAQQQLKIYRQAVLKWAFKGKLTNKEVKEGELPRGWKLQPLKEITSVLGDGLHGTPKYSELGGYYFINGNNLTDGKIEIKENTKRVNVEEYEKYKKPLNDRTILVSINGSLGYTAFYNNEKVVLGKSACYFNLLDNVDKNYVRYYLTSNSFTSYAEKSATGSTIMNVGLKAMREFHVPMPPSIHEQQSIVQEIESRLSVCDKVEETITTSLQQAETLRQSILKKAFEGKLV